MLLGQNQPDLSLESDRPSTRVRTSEPEGQILHSTGLYAPPGEPVTVVVPQAIVDSGVSVQVVCMTIRSGTSRRSGASLDREVIPNR